MLSQPALPPLLAPYLSSPSQSPLTLITSVLSATGNWLVLRFLYAALSSNVALGGDNFDGKKRKVVLVSFLRGMEFWKGEAKRLGLDLVRLADKKQFEFVDGLSELFSSAAALPTASPARIGAASPRGTLPIRSQPGAVPARALHPALGASTSSLDRPSAETGSGKRLHLAGRGIAALDALEKDIVAVIDQLKTTKAGDEEDSEVLLIIDQPDLLLAATGPNMGIGATEMNEWVMGLQQHADSTIMTVSADSPLIHNASTYAHQQATPLETEQAAFVIGSAHQARTVMQLRNLETGAAKDVSGVLRISKGGAWEDRDDEGAENSWEEKEVLYFIQRDGGARVFGRGE